MFVSGLRLVVSFGSRSLLALCQLALLLAKGRLLEAICLSRIVQFAVGAWAWTDVVFVAALVRTVIHFNIHRVLFGFSEELACHVVALVSCQWSVIANLLRGVVVGWTWPCSYISIDRTACISFLTRNGAQAAT